MIALAALEGMPEVCRGDDLAGFIVDALGSGGHGPLLEGDVLAVAHKVVSKAEGRVRRLDEVDPGPRARELAANQGGKDPRHVQVVLDESAEVIRAAHGVLVCVTRHGYVCANAGVDASNVPGEDTVVLLPLDPDGSARRLRARFGELTGVRPGVIISDSFGRAWRHGQCDVAIGCAGLHPLADWRSRPDSHGRELRATWIATADELAAAADAARRKDGAQPVVLIRGAEAAVTPEDGPGAAALVRPAESDLFR